MRLVTRLGLATAVLVASAAMAADVKITGVHNCCPGCDASIKKVLGEAGVTNLTVTKGDIGFSADDPTKALTALFAAGYAGRVEGAQAPRQQGLRQIRGKTLKVEGIHNCCGQCTKAIMDAVKPLGKAELKPRETSFTITSETEIEGPALMRALRMAGYNGKISAP